MSSDSEQEERDIEALATTVVEEGVHVVRRCGVGLRWDVEAKLRWKRASADISWLRQWRRHQDVMNEALSEHQDAALSATID